MNLLRSGFFVRLFSGEPEAVADALLAIIVIAALVMIYLNKKKKSKKDQAEKDLDK